MKREREKIIEKGNESLLHGYSPPLRCPAGGDPEGRSRPHPKEIILDFGG